MTKTSVLFVCLGNICRSPVAEGVFKKKLQDYNLEHLIETDSAGTAAWHVGNPPDSRMIKTAANRGIDISDLRARQVTSKDFAEFDYILAMDFENLYNLQDIAPENSKAHLSLYLDYASSYHEKEVPDPYYGGEEGFDHVINMVDDAANGLLDTIKKQKSA